VVTLPSKARFSFQEARSAWGNCDWIGSGRMAIDGLKEVQEAVMLIEAGLSTYENESQDTDNGYSVFEQSLLRYIAAGLGVSYEQLSRNYAQMSYSTARASANESWAYFMGRRKFVASRQASQMFLCWLEEAIVRRVVTLPSKARFSFQEARSAWGNCDWI
ncbi:phage portal protein, partial [Aeromonas veronii]|uniref:phage portal protein n=1 Tax=Aeromonas veronii TaxID=654 RepID=UPI0030048265